MNTWKTRAETVHGVVFSPDGTRLATYGDADRYARLWDPLTRKEVAAFETPGEKVGTFEPFVNAVAFSPCGRYLAVAGATIGDNHPSVRIWELATGAVVVPDLYPAGPPVGMAFTPGERPGLLIADCNRLNYFVDALATKPDTKPKLYNRGPDRKAPKCSRVYFAPDGKRIATNGRPKAVIWDAKTLKPLFVRDHTKSPQNGPAAFDPDSRVLAVAHGTKVDLWPFEEPGADVIELVGHKMPVWAVGFLRDGQTVQTASSDGTVRLWDRATGTERSCYDFGIGKVYCAAFAPDGLTCAAGGEKGRVVIWDVEV